jgi:glutamate dehydrogenase/leucine dehydrogenase
MISSGLEVIACGANVPFIDDTVFFGDTALYTDNKVSVIPDFIANCGMARVFAYLMQKDALLTDQAIFGDVSETIRKTLEELHASNKHNTGISARALQRSVNKLMS